MADFAAIRFQPSRPLLRELSADRLNSILTEIKRNKPKGEHGITVRQSGDGTYIGLAANIKGNAAATTATQPWDIISSPHPSIANQYLLSVVPGTFNGILPSNWNTEGANGAKNVTANNSSTYYCKAALTTDGIDITSVEVKINTTPPVAQSAQSFAIQTTIDYLFGVFQAGVVKRVIGQGHIVAPPVLWMQKEAAGAQPGELSWVNYYRLQ